MNVIVVVVTGGIIGALDGVGIFFAAGEPFKIEIFSCGDLEEQSILSSCRGGLRCQYSDCRFCLLPVVDRRLRSRSRDPCRRLCARKATLGHYSIRRRLMDSRSAEILSEHHPANVE